MNRAGQFRVAGQRRVAGQKRVAGQFWVVLVSTHVRAGRVRVGFFQLVRVTGRVSVRVFFTILTLNPTLT